MPIAIDRIDHVVLTVRSIAATSEFYARVLGMSVVKFDTGRVALAFGQQKFNLHQVGNEFEPKSDRPTSGSADFCLVTSTPLGQVVQYIESCGVPIELGPVTRTGAVGTIQSIYVRDPDGNLVEIANY